MSPLPTIGLIITVLISIFGVLFETREDGKVTSAGWAIIIFLFLSGFITAYLTYEDNRSRERARLEQIYLNNELLSFKLEWFFPNLKIDENAKRDADKYLDEFYEGDDELKFLDLDIRDGFNIAIHRYFIIGKTLNSLLWISLDDTGTSNVPIGILDSCKFQNQRETSSVAGSWYTARTLWELVECQEEWNEFLSGQSSIRPTAIDMTYANQQGGMLLTVLVAPQVLSGARSALELSNSKLSAWLPSRLRIVVSPPSEPIDQDPSARGEYEGWVEFQGKLNLECHDVAPRLRQSSNIKIWPNGSTEFYAEYSLSYVPSEIEHNKGGPESPQSARCKPAYWVGERIFR
jgi:hypothetical protein